jgi:putative peptidoglycan lipid II flippase
MSRQLRAGETKDANRSQNRGIELSHLLTNQAAIVIAVLSYPMVVVLFQRGAFGEAQSLATSAALSAYALGLPAYVLIKVLAPGFFAREDTRTPVKIAVVCLTANVVVVLALIVPLQHVGIALATVLSSWLNAGLLGFILYRRGLFDLDDRLRYRLPRILAAGLAMAAVVWGVMPAMADLMPMAPALALTIMIGTIAFFAIAQAVGAFEFGDVKALLRRR